MLTVYAAIHRRLLTFTIRVWYKLISLEARYLYMMFSIVLQDVVSPSKYFVTVDRGSVKDVIEKKVMQLCKNSGILCNLYIYTFHDIVTACCNE